MSQHVTLHEQGSGFIRHILLKNIRSVTLKSGV